MNDEYEYDNYGTVSLCLQTEISHQWASWVTLFARESRC